MAYLSDHYGLVIATYLKASNVIQVILLRIVIPSGDCFLGYD